jgi:hypothetical protein
VFGKFEEYLTSEVGRGINKAEHDALNSRYQETIQAVQDPREGLYKRLQDLQTRVSHGIKALGSGDIT